MEETLVWRAFEDGHSRRRTRQCKVNVHFSKVISSRFCFRFRKCECSCTIFDSAVRRMFYFHTGSFLVCVKIYWYTVSFTSTFRPQPVPERLQPELQTNNATSRSEYRYYRSWSLTIRRKPLDYSTRVRRVISFSPTFHRFVIWSGERTSRRCSADRRPSWQVQHKNLHRSCVP